MPSLPLEERRSNLFMFSTIRLLCYTRNDETLSFWRPSSNASYMKKTKSNIIVLFYIVILITLTDSLSAQYAPPAGQIGTTAIHADSNIFIDWANNCTVERGWADISLPELGMVTYGSDTSGVAKADNGVVSLGDGGVATLNFDIPIANGPGWDFAVFENSFLDNFLELAFVEVSSNGIDYYRFNSISLTQPVIQIGGFGLLDATQINNLAGKYRGMYGVPFELSELVDITGLDLANIISIRIIDVVGSIDDNYATYDSEGSIINDPWPTPFESGGFDLDAVGVINNRNNTSVNEVVKNATDIIFPNPAKSHFNISLVDNIKRVILTDMRGNLFIELNNPHENNIDITYLPSGYYIVKIITKNKMYTVKLIKL